MMNRPVAFMLVFVLFLLSGIFADAWLGGWMPWFNAFALLQALQLALQGIPVTELPQFIIGQEFLGTNALWIGVLFLPLFYGAIAFLLVELHTKIYGPKKIDLTV